MPADPPQATEAEAEPGDPAWRTPDRLAALRSEVRRCEERLEKLNDMRDRLATRLADPELYAPGMGTQAETWQKKYAEVMEGIDRAEDLWLRAQQRLEDAAP